MMLCKALFTIKAFDQTVEVLTVCVKVSTTDFLFFSSAYFPLGRRVSAAALDKMSCVDYRRHVIGADVNVHHPLWDPHTPACSGGSLVVDFCIDQGYTIINSGAPTRRSLNTTEAQLSSPDVTLIRGCIGTHWEAKPSADSDHFFITYEITVGDDTPLDAQTRRARYVFCKGRLEEIQIACRQRSSYFPVQGISRSDGKTFI